MEEWILLRVVQRKAEEMGYDQALEEDIIHHIEEIIKNGEEGWNDHPDWDKHWTPEEEDNPAAMQPADITRSTAAHLVQPMQAYTMMPHTACA